ncbi:MAG: hypothetical protein QM708_04530 [Propioniciclava sp.]|uniref:hypothetical protein n=1 Tax=Propioniciclava sp. TaxID=2038686 RepID=UPI0039E5F994
MPVLPSRAERGVSVLQTVGMVALSGVLAASLLAVVSEGRVAATASYGFCTVTGGSCVDPRVPAGFEDAARCTVPTTGPSGATRLSYRVDLGAGTPVVVAESAGGAYTVTAGDAGTITPALAAAAAGPRASASRARVYTAASQAELGTLLAGLQRQQRQESWFGAGGHPAADVWAATGSLLFTAAGEPAAPVPTGVWESSGPGLMPSSYAYDLAQAVTAQGTAVSVGTTTWQGGGSTELLVGGMTSADRAGVVIELDRDAGGFVTEVRATRTGVGGQVSSLPVTSDASASDAEALLTGLGVASERRYAYAPGPPAGPLADAGPLDAFRAAAAEAGYVSRAPGAGLADGGSPVALAELGATMKQARKDAPPAQYWDGDSWQTWTGCE